MQVGVQAAWCWRWCLRLRQGPGCRHPLPEKSFERLHARQTKFERRQMKAGRPTRLPRCSGLKALTWLHQESCWCKP